MNIRKQLDELIKRREFDERGLGWNPPDEHPDEHLGEAFEDAVKELYGDKDNMDGTKAVVDETIIIVQQLMDTLQQMKEGVNYR
jgi:hypothetical protein